MNTNYNVVKSKMWSYLHSNENLSDKEVEEICAMAVSLVKGAITDLENEHTLSARRVKDRL